MKKQRLIILFFGLLLLGCQRQNQNTVKNTQKTTLDKPNILLIMADDMGYSDIGCYGGEINTPSLDNLAQEGVRFTQFYNGARCCPTRATLLTGISPHLAGMGGMVKHHPSEQNSPYQGYLNDQCVTLAEVLKPAGYRSYMTGKWHVGEFPSTFPIDRGFDKYYGLISGAMNYWNITKGKRKKINRTFVEDTTVINDQINNGFYATTAYTDKAISYLDNHFANYQESPFFLYIAHQAPHWPLHAPDSVIQKYRGKYLGGWEQLRKQRYQRMLDLGILEKGQLLSPPDSNTKDWSTLTATQKDSMDLKMATYAAMIEVMDQNIGRIISTLKEKGALDNTLIIFLSDNGASYEFGSLGQNFRPDLNGSLGSEDSYYSYGSSWANASNTPFQKFKKFTYEGGISTPFIARWGNNIKNKGAITTATGHISDIMATVVDVAGAEYPKQFNQQEIHPLEGKSLLSVLEGKEQDVRTEVECLIWEHEGNKAVRQGDWKLVKQNEDKNWKLFNIKTDRSEQNDVSSMHEEIVNTLKTKYRDWSTKVGVIINKESN